MRRYLALPFIALAILPSCAKKDAGGTASTAAATFQGVSPAVGPIWGGVPLTVTGTNIKSDATVKIGTTACASPVVAPDGTSVKCTIPAGVAGPALDVTVTSSGSTTTLKSAFTYAGDAFSRIDLTVGAASPCGFQDGTGTAAYFNTPQATVVDASGNTYVADTYNNTIRKITPAGAVITIAGKVGINGYADGIGTAATFSWPDALALDGAGNLYVADAGYSLIRKIVLATGAVSTLAGNPFAPGKTDATGTSASFNQPSALAINGGYLYVAEYNNSDVRRIQLSNAAVTTFAGDGFDGYIDAAGTGARFSNPAGLAFDGSGNLYVADSFNNNIRRIDSAANVTTVVGSTGSLAGDSEGTGTAARFFNPTGLTTDGTYLYVADQYNFKVRQVRLSDFHVTTLAGNGFSGTNSLLDGLGSSALFNLPAGIAFDGIGSIVVADTQNCAIRKVAIGSTMVSTFAGSTAGMRSGNADGTGTAARIFSPIAAVRLGNLTYTVEQPYGLIRSIDANNSANLVAGGGASAGGDGVGSAASFLAPSAIATDGTALYVADTGDNTIRRVAPNTGSVTTIAGTTGPSGSAFADNTGTLARFRGPSGLASDGSSLYIADTYNYRIRKLVIATGQVTTIAGTGTSGVTDGTGTAARFYYPTAMTTDGANLYVADQFGTVIRKISISSAYVSTLAGSSFNQTTNDGTGTSASFQQITGLTTDGTNLYASDASGTIRKIAISSGTVTTIAGKAGYSQDTDGPISSAYVQGPLGLLYDPAVGITILENSSIRKLH